MLITTIFSFQGDNELFYKFSPVLMQHIPRETVDVWKQRDLDPRKLIPALVTHEQQTDDAYVSVFLQSCLHTTLYSYRQQKFQNISIKNSDCSSSNQYLLHWAKNIIINKYHRHKYHRHKYHKYHRLQIL